MPRGIKRLFVAIALAPDVKKSLSEIQKELQKSGADVKWVEPENIHITLKFLGNVAEEKIKPIGDILKELARRRPHFEIPMTHIGAFPSLSFPRVIWAGFEDPKNHFKEITQATEDKLNRLGFAEEDREVTPHATLGRLRSPRNKIFLREKIDEANESFKQATVDVQKITLFESRLAPKGPAYFTIAKFNLMT